MQDKNNDIESAIRKFDIDERNKYRRGIKINRKISSLITLNLFFFIKKKESIIKSKRRMRDALDFVKKKVMERSAEANEKNEDFVSSYLKMEKKIGIKRKDENVFGYWKNEANLPLIILPLNMLGLIW